MFKGVYTALITPFQNGVLDEAALRELVEWQITEGVHGLVMSGTTGESPTLTTEEFRRLIEITVETARGRVPVIAGTGTNSTAAAIERTRLAKETGAAAALVVLPYYNKPTQEGLRRHFEAINDAVDLPVIIYNVPSRCGIDMSVATMAALSQLPNIAGVKDATNDLSRPLLTRRQCKPGFSLLTGENDTFGAYMAQGGDGGILVTSNVVPRALRDMYDAWVSRDIDRFSSLNRLLVGLHKALFCETNPSPVKYAVSKLGKCRNELRLPMCPASRAAQDAVDEALKPLIDAGYA